MRRRCWPASRSSAPVFRSMISAPAIRSLAYLQRFPFDTIKIDRSLVKQSGKGVRPVILRSIIALAQDLGMDVVAEGAETEADAIELYQLGCGYAQGYAFGRPISAQEARRLVGAAPEAA